MFGSDQNDVWQGCRAEPAGNEFVILGDCEAVMAGMRAEQECTNYRIHHHAFLAHRRRSTKMKGL